MDPRRGFTIGIRFTVEIDLAIHTSLLICAHRNPGRGDMQCDDST